MCIWSHCRKILGFYSQQQRNRVKPRQDKGCNRRAPSFKRQRCSTPNRENSCTEPFHVQCQQQMPTLLVGSEKGLLVGRTLPGSVHSTKDQSELSPPPPPPPPPPPLPHLSKPLLGGTPHSLPGGLRFLNQHCPG